MSHIVLSGRPSCTSRDSPFVTDCNTKPVLKRMRCVPLINCDKLRKALEANPIVINNKRTPRAWWEMKRTTWYSIMDRDDLTNIYSDFVSKRSNTYLVSAIYSLLGFRDIIVIRDDALSPRWVGYVFSKDSKNFRKKFDRTLMQIFQFTQNIKRRYKRLYGPSEGRNGDPKRKLG